MRSKTEGEKMSCLGILPDSAQPALMAVVPAGREGLEQTPKVRGDNSRPELDRRWSAPFSVDCFRLRV
jgi:hypothetical protein